MAASKVTDDFGPDVADVIMAQHEAIRTQFPAVAMARGEEKERLFRELVIALAAHEAAEAAFVHALARPHAGDVVVDDRLVEEQGLESAMQALHLLGTSNVGFDQHLGQLGRIVHAHSRAEELEELPRVRLNVPRVELRKLADLYREAQATAQADPQVQAWSTSTDPTDPPASTIFHHVGRLVRQAAHDASGL